MKKSLHYIGLDVHKETMTIAIAESECTPAYVLATIPNDWASLCKHLDQLGPRKYLRVCYEAGPTGFGLARRLIAAGIDCQVVAPFAGSHTERLPDYQFLSQQSKDIQRRRKLVSLAVRLIAEKAEQRLSRRFRKLAYKRQAVAAGSSGRCPRTVWLCLVNCTRGEIIGDVKRFLGEGPEAPVPSPRRSNISPTVTGGSWTLDLEKFFDRVNHDVLMGRIAKRVSDNACTTRRPTTSSRKTSRSS